MNLILSVLKKTHIPTQWQWFIIYRHGKTETFLPCRRTFQASEWAAPLRRPPWLCQMCRWKATESGNQIRSSNAVKYIMTNRLTWKSKWTHWLHTLEIIKHSGTHFVHTVALLHHCTINCVLQRQGGLFSSTKLTTLKETKMLKNSCQYSQGFPLPDIPL